MLSYQLHKTTSADTTRAWNYCTCILNIPLPQTMDTNRMDGGDDEYGDGDDDDAE